MLEFAWPWVFIALPLPWLLRSLLPSSHYQSAALRVHCLAELEQLSGQKARRLQPLWRQQLPFIFLWLLLLLAAARPQYLGDWQPAPSSGRDLLFAVDISGSMDTPDRQWQGETLTRLEQVKQLFGNFIEARHGDRMGLILFGSQAYLQSPLTFDRKTLRQWLEEATVGLAGHNTAIGEAIGLAIKHLRQKPIAPHEQRLLILITDGANNSGTVDPHTAARRAAAEQIRIHCIGILSLNAGPSSPEALDEALLQNIAQTTGGRYFRATSGETLSSISRTLDQIEPKPQEARRQRAVQPLYPWPLTAALLIAVVWLIPPPLFQRRRTL